MEKQVTKNPGDLMETPARGEGMGEQPKSQILHPIPLPAQEHQGCPEWWKKPQI